MLVTYPALFYYDDTDGTEATYLSISQILNTQLHKERGFLRLWLWGQVARDNCCRFDRE